MNKMMLCALAAAMSACVIPEGGLEQQGSSAGQSSSSSLGLSSSALDSNQIGVSSSDSIRYSAQVQSSSSAIVWDTLHLTIGAQNSEIQDAEVNFPKSQLAGNLSDLQMDSYPWLSAGSYDASTVGRGLVRFALPDSLKGLVLKAQLEVPLYEWYSKTINTNATVVVHPVLKAWSENHVNAEITGLGANWSQVGLAEGADYGAALAQVTKQYGEPGAWNFDVTGQVNLWVHGQSPNYGFVLRNTQEFADVDYGYPKFASNANAEHALLHLTILRPR